MNTVNSTKEWSEQSAEAMLVGIMFMETLAKIRLANYERDIKPTYDLMLIYLKTWDRYIESVEG